MSIKSASPIRYQHQQTKHAILPESRRADSPPTGSLTCERMPPACETCSGRRLLSDRLVKLCERMTERDLEFQKLIQDKTELLQIAAHDLRLPLATIRTCSEMLVEGADAGTNAEQFELIESIRSVSEFMVRLLDDTLDLARLESGTLQLHAAPGILATIVAKSVSMSFPVAARKHMSLTLIQDGGPQPVLADPVKMSKVFNNLIENAIMYCQPGARIEVKISREGDTVVVSVQDDGPGIDPVDVKTLFTPFQKTRAQALSGEPSTGLGLAIAKQILDLHGGRIWVKSEVGQGTTFFVSLPVQIQSAAKKS